MHSYKRTIPLKIVLIAIILGMLLASHTHAAKLRRGEPAYKERQDKLNKVAQLSQYAHTLVSNVQLHLETGGQTDNVIKFLKDSLSETAEDRAQLEDEYHSEMDRLDTLISSLKNDIRDLISEQEFTVLRIQQLNVDIRTLTQHIEDLEGELISLDQREEWIRKARENDVDAFNVRQQRDKKALEALDEVIPQLKAFASDSSFVQRSSEEITQILSRIPKGKAIEALIQVSSTFNRAKLESVIRHLERLQDQVADSKADDEQHELASRQRYEELIDQLVKVRGDKSKSLNTAKSELTQASNEQEQAVVKKSHLETSIKNNKEILDASIATQEVEDGQYKRRIEEAKATIKAIQEVLDTLEGDESDIEDAEGETDTLVGEGF